MKKMQRRKFLIALLLSIQLFQAKEEVVIITKKEVPKSIRQEKVTIKKTIKPSTTEKLKDAVGTTAKVIEYEVDRGVQGAKKVINSTFVHAQQAHQERVAKHTIHRAAERAAEATKLGGNALKHAAEGQAAGIKNAAQSAYLEAKKALKEKQSHYEKNKAIKKAKEAANIAAERK